MSDMPNIYAFRPEMGRIAKFATGRAFEHGHEAAAEVRTVVLDPVTASGVSAQGWRLAVPDDD
jgi:hypothetical protein